MTKYCSECGKPNDTDAVFVEIEVVLDRSGSMGSLRDDAIGGYNAWLAAQQADPSPANLTTTLFDNEFITAPTRPLSEGVPLTTETYVPRGGTALYDAIGRALNRLDAKNAPRSILVVLTDGQENASTEFTRAQVMQRIERAQSRGWQVVYLSASPSAFADSAAIGIRAANTVQFAATGAGLRSAYHTMTASNLSYRSNGDTAPVVAPDDDA